MLITAVLAIILKSYVQFYLQGSWLSKSKVMARGIPYLVGAVARVHTLNGSFPHQNVVFFSPFQHLHVCIPIHVTVLDA